MTANRPIYCRDCTARDSYVEHEKMNIKYESGQVMERCWKCKRCGHITWRLENHSEGSK